MTPHLLFNLAWSVTLWLAVVMVGLWLLGRAPAAARRRLCRLGLVGIAIVLLAAGAYRMRSPETGLWSVGEPAGRISIAAAPPVVDVTQLPAPTPQPVDSVSIAAGEVVSAGERSTPPPQAPAEQAPDLPEIAAASEPVHASTAAAPLRFWPIAAWTLPAVSVLLLVRLIGGLWKLSRWQRTWRPAPRAWVDIVARVADRIGHRRPVKVMTAANLPAPAAAGVFREVVALPETDPGPIAPGIRDVLAHELGHLAGRDPLWQVIASLVAALAWWCPLTWWLHRRCRIENELTADDHALAAGARPASLAATLAAFAEAHTAPAPVAVSGMACHLTRRVKMMLNNQLPHTPRVSRPVRWLLPIAACVMIATIAAVPLVRTADAQAVAPAKTPSKQADKIERHVVELIDALERLDKSTRDRTETAELLRVSQKAARRGEFISEEILAEARKKRDAANVVIDKAGEDVLRLCTLIAPLRPIPVGVAPPAAPPGRPMGAGGAGMGMGGMGMGAMGMGGMGMGTGDAYGAGMGGMGMGGMGGMGTGAAYGGGGSFGYGARFGHGAPDLRGIRNNLLTAAKEFQSNAADRSRVRGLDDRDEASQARVRVSPPERLPGPDDQDEARQARIIVADTLFDEADDNLREQCRRYQAAQLLSEMSERINGLRREIQRADRALVRLREKRQAREVDQATVSLVEKRRTERSRQLERMQSKAEQMRSLTLTPQQRERERAQPEALRIGRRRGSAAGAYGPGGGGAYGGPAPPGAGSAYGGMGGRGMGGLAPGVGVFTGPVVRQAPQPTKKPAAATVDPSSRRGDLERLIISLETQVEQAKLDVETARKAYKQNAATDHEVKESEIRLHGATRLLESARQELKKLRQDGAGAADGG